MSLPGAWPSLFVLLALDGGVEPGVVVERWDDGKPRHTNFYAGEGRQRRLVREITYFTNGKPWVVFDHAGDSAIRSTYSGWNGALLERVRVIAGRSTGPFLRWNEKGGLAEQGDYRHGQRIGLWVEYDSEGRKHGETFYDPPAHRLWARTYFPDGRIQQERLPSGASAEYYPNGQPYVRNDGKGKVESFAPDGRRLVQHRLLPNGHPLLWYAWDNQGKACVVKGNGARIEADGEYGTLSAVLYRGGEPVRQGPPPAGKRARDCVTRVRTSRARGR